MPAETRPPRRSQAARRAETRAALLAVGGRRGGRVHPGRALPPARVLAAACLSSLEGLAIGIAGRTPHDEDLAERVVVGLLRG